MRNARLLLISSVLILGLSYSAQGNPENRKINSIQPGDIGEEIQVQGKIKSFESYNSTIFMNISGETGDISAVRFRSTKRFSKNQRVRAHGEVTMYNGKLELVLDSISRIKPSE